MCNCHQHILTEGLKQKVLLEAAGEFNLTVPNIKKYYTIWNKKAFDNKLPQSLPTKISNRDRAVGHVKSRFGHVYEFAISGKFKHTEKQFTETLLHEMIHVWQVEVKGTRGGHGQDFVNMMHKLNSKFGFDITVKDSGTVSQAKAKVQEEGVWILLIDYTKMGKRVQGFNFYTDDIYAMRHYNLFKEDIEKNATKGELTIIHGKLDMITKWRGYKIHDKTVNKQTYYPIRMSSQWADLEKSGKPFKAWEKKEDKAIIQRDEEKKAAQYFLQLFTIEKPSIGIRGYAFQKGSKTSGVNVFSNLDDAKKSAENWKSHDAISYIRTIPGNKLTDYLSLSTVKSAPSYSQYHKINAKLWQSLYYASQSVNG